MFVCFSLHQKLNEISNLIIFTGDYLWEWFILQIFLRLFIFLKIITKIKNYKNLDTHVQCFVLRFGQYSMKLKIMIEMSCDLRINSIHWEKIYWCIIVATWRCSLGDIVIVAKTYRHRGKFMRFNFFQVDISSSFLFKKCQNLKLNNIDLLVCIFINQKKRPCIRINY